MILNFRICLEASLVHRYEALKILLELNRHSNLLGEDNSIVVCLEGLWQYYAWFISRSSKNGMKVYESRILIPAVFLATVRSCISAASGCYCRRVPRYSLPGMIHVYLCYSDAWKVYPNAPSLRTLCGLIRSCGLERNILHEDWREHRRHNDGFRKIYPYYRSLVPSRYHFPDPDNSRKPVANVRCHRCRRRTRRSQRRKCFGSCKTLSTPH